MARLSKRGGDWLLVADRIVTFDPDIGVIDDGAVLVSGDRVKAIGRRDKIAAGHSGRVVSARGSTLMPGLVNAHMRLRTTLARAMPLPVAAGGAPSPANFMEIQQARWGFDRALVEEDLYPSAVVSLCESLRKGVTTVFDHHASPACAPGSLDIVAEACADVGVRASLSYEVSDRDGARAAAQGIEENRRFLQRCADDRDPLRAGLFGLHTQSTLGDDTLTQCSEIGRALRAGFFVHIAESLDDQTDATARTGSDALRAVHRLNRFKLLSPKTVAAHCVHVTANEIAVLAKTGTAVVTNPQSNMHSGVGATPVFDLVDAGVLVALGSAGMTGDIFQEARTLALRGAELVAGRGRRWDEAERVTLQGAQRLGARHFGAAVGVLKPGAYADLVLRDYASPTPVTHDNVWAHFQYGLGICTVSDVWVGGEQVVDGGRVTGVHEESVARDASERAQALWDRL